MAIRVTRTGVVLAVGILISAVVVAGVLHFVRERGEQARREDAIAIAEENLKAESEQNPAIDVTIDGEAEESNGDESAPVASNELPQTGPELMAIVALGALTFAASSYIVSLRRLRL